MAQSSPRDSEPITAERPSRTLLWIAAAIVIGALILWAVVQAVRPGDPLAGAIESKRYQAVFLTNGQVYFGKLSAPGGGYYTLRHVYYLTTAPTAKGKGATPTLKKLTNDIHGPEDEVVINGTQILYVENLDPRGRAAQILSASSP